MLDAMLGGNSLEVLGGSIPVLLPTLGLKGHMMGTRPYLGEPWDGFHRYLSKRVKIGSGASGVQAEIEIHMGSTIPHQATSWGIFLCQESC